jgi:ERCC4-type nuclease
MSASAHYLPRSIAAAPKLKKQRGPYRRKARKKKAKNMPGTLWIDVHEAAHMEGLFIDEMNELEWQDYDVIVKGMDVADYLSSNGVLIELKRINDAVSSIEPVDGYRTMQIQFENMIKARDDGFKAGLVIVGNYDDIWAKTESKRQARWKGILKWVSRFQAQRMFAMILPKENDFIRYTLNLIDESDHLVVKHKPSPVKLRDADMMTNIFMQIKGVGFKIAPKLAEHWPYPAALVGVTAEEIEVVVADKISPNPAKIKPGVLANRIWKRWNFPNEAAAAAYKTRQLYAAGD